MSTLTSQRIIFHPFHLLIAIAFLLTACEEVPHTPINLAGNNWLGYQPLFAAHEIGRTHHRPKLEHTHNDELSKASHHFSMTVLPSTTSVMRKLSSGQLDGAMLTLNEAIVFMDKNGMDLCVSHIFNYSNGADALVVNPGYYKVADKRKMRIGYESTALGNYMLKRAIETLNLQQDSIEFFTIEPMDHFSSYQSGRIDGIITFEPFLSQIKTLGGEVRFSSEDIPKEIIDVLVVKSDVWAENKHDFRDLLDIVWGFGLKMMKKNDDRVIEFIQSFTDLNADTLSESIKGIHYTNYEESQALLHGDFTTSLEKMNNYLYTEKKISRKTTLNACR